MKLSGMLTIKFTVPTEPVPFKRSLVNGKRHFNDPRYSDFKNVVGLHAKAAMRGQAPLTDAVKISVVISTKYKPTSLRAGDIDNHLKAAMDALNEIGYTDDRQVVEAHIYLFKGEPQLEITLEELTRCD
ncbi:MAG: RusA family crossover junction endodeoxyribonuclease [Selenomonadaceae bacterium]|nr:RusA family crossover junction endodeoxyribonuclease [Selenomonadaceae bacterium]MBR4384149.1 RusA family crossover junction endodeoxyribonuclease [Selenomonadaceae bacterium]